LSLLVALGEYPVDDREQARKMFRPPSGKVPNEMADEVGDVDGLARGRVSGGSFNRAVKGWDHGA
jgi:hypothetical protein